MIVLYFRVSLDAFSGTSSDPYIREKFMTIMHTKLVLNLFAFKFHS